MVYKVKWSHNGVESTHSTIQLVNHSHKIMRKEIVVFQQAENEEKKKPSSGRERDGKSDNLN